MYAFIDQPVERLCNGGRFLLWAIRGWASATGQGRCPQGTLGKCFAGVGAASALSVFDAAARLLDRHAIHALTPAPMGCCTIGESEAILLRLWRDVARGDRAVARGTLALLVSPARVDAVADAMASAAQALAAAGFDLSDLSHRTLKEEK